MFGAIIGDMAGTKYEYPEAIDTKKGIINIERRRSILNPAVELLTEDSFFSDDTILTVAIAEAAFYNIDYGENLRKYTRLYEKTPSNKGKTFEKAFSSSFLEWANSDSTEKRESIGNGAGMRVSSIAYIFDDLEKVKQEAMKTAIPSHDSEEAIKGAESIASAVFLARKKYSKEAIKKHIIENYGYDLNYDLKTLQETNTFNGTCNVTVPQAIFIFLISNDFEDSIRKAISIGGDTDTIACMTGAIAGAFYGIPQKLKNKALELLSGDLRKVLLSITEKLGEV